MEINGLKNAARRNKRLARRILPSRPATLAE